MERLSQDGYELPGELLEAVSSDRCDPAGQADAPTRLFGLCVSADAEPAGREAPSGRGARATAASAALDPALKMSELYAARSKGVEPGLTTQQQREAAVRKSIPGGDRELPSEIRRSPTEPESARRLPAEVVASETLQWANLSPESRKLRLMQQQVAQLAAGPGSQKPTMVLQNEENKSAGASTEVPKVAEVAKDTPKAGATESSGSTGQDKFYESMASFLEVMKEKESAGSIIKWDR